MLRRKTLLGDLHLEVPVVHQVGHLEELPELREDPLQEQEGSREHLKAGLQVERGKREGPAMGNQADLWGGEHREVQEVLQGVHRGVQGGRQEVQEVLQEEQGGHQEVVREEQGGHQGEQEGHQEVLGGHQEVKEGHREEQEGHREVKEGHREEQVEHQVEPEGHREACQAEGLPEEPSEVQAVVEVLRQSW